MTRTRRRKIARSVAIRRVKQNAKRKERKTQKRKSRNKVMKGGVHKNLKLYVIQKKLGDPKCIIVRQPSRTLKDIIYLFFDVTLSQDEINEFVCAATGLDTNAVIALNLPSNKNGILIVKLTVDITWSYYLSSGFIRPDEPIPGKTFRKYAKSLVGRKNGEEIIKSLEEKTKTMDDYTFTDVTENDKLFKNKVFHVFHDEDFTLEDVLQLFQSVETETKTELNEFCLVPEKPISEKIEKLKKLVKDSKIVDNICSTNAGNLLRGKSGSRSAELQTQIEESKRKTLEEIREKNLYYSGESKTEATTLIDDIKKDPSYGTCIPAIDRIAYGTWSDYINGKTTIKSVEEKIADAYAGSYY